MRARSPKLSVNALNGADLVKAQLNDRSAQSRQSAEEEPFSWLGRRATIESSRVSHMSRHHQANQSHNREARTPTTRALASYVELRVALIYM